MTRTVEQSGPRQPLRTETSAALATYVFAVCRGGDPAAVAELSGQAPGAPVRLLRFGSLEAVVQDVPAAEFGAETLRERLADRADLERCARAHHSVIAAMAGSAPTLPLPLATLYLGDERARVALRADERRFLAVLERITGRVEWGVKVYARPEAKQGPDRSAEAPGAPGSGAAGSGTRSGRAYLERVRGARQDRERRQQAGLAAAEAVDRALRGIAVASRRLRTHETTLTGERGVQLLNAAYLVAEGDEHDVAAAVREVRRSPACRSVEVEVTGPWVPYSFVDDSFVDGGEPDARG
ncbi:GvpL/GvpF family gas vesicle protein [Streptomyces smyrnaeus]|uniref:GvpL/GvpF family gas vesicle protein n=1 Tax=Streptomyces TaxID=1883 RepID=UPI001615A284|nr:GvpL/GvpF family gas vesicle protein [Streptomyces sp. B15]MBQ1124020.1 GvpL/GvpF family gas vesicle protein [Streptomyces sp. B15]MBQ1159331.1 GvpL/GvpF family gas vesicle protein [Streptomyces sp. A73]